MAKLKFDAQKVKQFAVEKIEIVGMGVCALLTLLFLFMGISAMLGSSSEDQAILKDAKAYKKAIDDARPEVAATKEEEKNDGLDTSWAAAPPDRYLSTGSLFDAAAAGDTKKRNPLVLPI